MMSIRAFRKPNFMMDQSLPPLRGKGKVVLHSQHDNTPIQKPGYTVRPMGPKNHTLV